MKEDFLHYLWEFQKWKVSPLTTYEGISLSVLSPGRHNFSSGPDFFNSQLVIGDQKWAGNVEIHLNSSDWYAHHHENDSHYDNVILHVVWNHDTEIYRKNNSTIPVLELKSFVSTHTLSNYEYLLKNPSAKWINCEDDFSEFEDFHLQNWLERLYFERLEEKANRIREFLKQSANDWEEVLFRMLARNFGLNLNGEAFLSMATSIPFSLVRKLSHRQQLLEALFFGQTGLLENNSEEPYFQWLQESYKYLQLKYDIKNEGVLPVKFFRLRPDNFPNIRLSQLAMLYHQRPRLFSEVIHARSLKELRELFQLVLHDFWGTHYTFGKKHPARKKRMSMGFIDLLIINSLIPMKFCYASSLDKDINEELLELVQGLKAESNTIINKFSSIRGKPFENALHSQALLQMKKRYCELHKCLRCSLGMHLLQRPGSTENLRTGVTE